MCSAWNKELKPIYHDILFLVEKQNATQNKTPKSTFALFVQNQRHLANTKQMPEVFEWCHFCELPSIRILITLHRHNFIYPPFGLWDFLFTSSNSQLFKYLVATRSHWANDHQLLTNIHTVDVASSAGPLCLIAVFVAAVPYKLLVHWDLVTDLVLVTFSQ